MLKTRISKESQFLVGPILGSGGYYLLAPLMLSWSIQFPNPKRGDD
jgi:hypothetical protein